MLATEPAVAASGRLLWRVAEVRKLIIETPRVKSLVLNVPGWTGHRAGQHLDVRLTGEDGCQAQRSYSIASAPESEGLSLTVEYIDDGEVSPYLTQEVRPGDRFEIRGPIGGHFVWTSPMGGPLFLIAGGSGIAPLMAMLRHRASAGSRAETTLLCSARAFEDIIYRAELDELAAQEDGLTVTHTLTRSQPVGWSGQARRIDRDMLASVGPPAAARPQIFVCGPTPLVETVARNLLDLGHDPARIKLERFGPTGL